MTRSKFSEQQIIGALKQVESGRTVAEVCREVGVSTATYFKWKSKFGGMEASDIRRMRELEEENRQHHGSHNATLRAKGLERMTSEDLVAMIPVDRATADKQEWEFPYQPLRDSLKKRCFGRVLLADTSDMTEIDSDLRKMLSKEGVKSFERSVDYGTVYIEHSIEF